MMDQLINRMLNAAKLDRSAYRAIVDDAGANAQAVIVVIAISFAWGIGSLGIAGPLGIVWGILNGLLGWVIFAGLAYWIGANLLPKPETHANWGQVARALAFARSPGILAIFGVLGFVSSGLGSFLLFVAAVWTIIASVVALQESLNYGDNWLRALVVAVLAFIPFLVIQALISTIA